LAFDHTEIVRYAVTRLQAKLEYTNAAMSLLPQTFALSDLQSVYESILGQSLDKRNFQKKFLSLGLLEPTDDMRTGGKHRPARLYRFSDTRPTELKKFF
jgi:8-oxo-dGTP diphosphatase